MKNEKKIDEMKINEKVEKKSVVPAPLNRWRRVASSTRKNMATPSVADDRPVAIRFIRNSRWAMSDDW